MGSPFFKASYPKTWCYLRGLVFGTSTYVFVSLGCLKPPSIDSFPDLILDTHKWRSAIDVDNFGRWKAVEPGR